MSSAPPRPPRWHVLVLALTSVAGLGYAPRAPGTVGTLAALPLWYALRQLSHGAFCAATLAVVLVSCVLSHLAEKIYGQHDVQRIVIDEVAGFLCTVLFVPFSPRLALLAFVLFRLLDATKPGPIGWVDAHVPGGTGVVLDDVAAGLVGCAILHGLHQLGWIAFAG